MPSEPTDGKPMTTTDERGHVRGSAVAPVERITLDQVEAARVAWRTAVDGLGKITMSRGVGASMAGMSLRAAQDPGRAEFEGHLAEIDALRQEYEDLRARYAEQQRDDETRASHELAVSNERIAKRQLWIAGAIGLFTFFQVVAVVLDHVHPSSTTVVCSGGK